MALTFYFVLCAWLVGCRLHDFQSGYFAEFSELSKTGSKLWKATSSMINADVSKASKQGELQ